MYNGRSTPSQWVVGGVVDQSGGGGPDSANIGLVEAGETITHSHTALLISAGVVRGYLLEQYCWGS